MQARFRLVDGDEAGRPVAEQRADQIEIAQRAVRQLVRGERPVDAGKAHGEPALAVVHADDQLGARKRIGDRGADRVGIAPAHISTVASTAARSLPSDDSVGDDSAIDGCPHRRLAVGADVVIEAPAQHGLPDRREFREAAAGRAPPTGRSPMRAASARIAACCRRRLRSFSTGPLRSTSAMPGAADRPSVSVSLRTIGSRSSAASPRPGRSISISYSKPSKLAPSSSRRSSVAGPPAHSTELDAALLGDLAADGAVGGGLQQAERAIEIGLASGVLADQHGQRLDRKSQRLEGSIALDSTPHAAA